MEFINKNYFVINLVTLSLILVTFISIGHWSPRNTTILNIFQQQQQQQQLQNKTNAEVDDLGEVLSRASTEDKTDTDVIWLRDPFPILKKFNDTDDLQISTDKFNGYATSIRNHINTGFYHVKSNNRTISLFETWYDRRQNSTGMKEQDVLEALIASGIVGKLHLKVRFLDTIYFSGFCKDSRDAASVATVHANCCRSIGAKVSDLTAVLKDWKRLNLKVQDNNGSGNSNSTVFQWSPHVACWNSWKTTPSKLTN